jgi:uncharacterized protein (TIGR00255 family)
MRSMTGFGKARAPLRQGTLDAEIRDELTPYESEMEDLVRKAVRRGAVQLTIRVEASRTQPDAPTLNRKALQSYLRQIRAAQKALKLSGEIPVGLLVSLPLVWAAEEADDDRGSALWVAARKATTHAVEELAAARDREGRGIRSACLGYLGAMERSLNGVRERAPSVVKEHQARLRERIGALLADAGARLSDQDLLRETAVFADKCDICEELQRLEAHLAEFRRQVDTGSEVGRRLDFLGQEILREANTIGVKANDYTISAAMVNLKAELEKVKEQLENVE